jgi:hypothetical protein
MICPEFFGCSGKLTFSETRALAHAAEGPLGDYSDVASNWVASIDRIGQCSLEMPVFAQVALTHVLRDLEAAAATAFHALVCYEFGDDASTDDRFQLVGSIAKAATARGIQIGKCHTVEIEGSTSIVICAIGKTRGKLRGLPETGIVWISHGLGASKLLYMRQIGTLADESDCLFKMTTPINLEAFSDRPSVISDISGHGLAGSLVDMAERHGIKIDVELGPQFALAEPVLTEEMTLFENSSDSYGAILVAVDRDANTLAFIKETAGPLLVLTAELPLSIRDNVVAAGWAAIGSFVRGAPEVSISWRA